MPIGGSRRKPWSRSTICTMFTPCTPVFDLKRSGSLRRSKGCTSRRTGRSCQHSSVLSPGGCRKLKRSSPLEPICVARTSTPSSFDSAVPAPPKPASDPPGLGARSLLQPAASASSASGGAASGKPSEDRRSASRHSSGASPSRAHACASVRSTRAARLTPCSSSRTPLARVCTPHGR